LPRKNLPFLLNGNRHMWDPTKLRMVLVGTLFGGLTQPLLPATQRDKLEHASPDDIAQGLDAETYAPGDVVDHIVHVYRNNLVAHTHRCALPMQARPPAFAKGFEDLVQIMQVFADKCVDGDALRDKVNAIVEAPDDSWTPRQLGEIRELERQRQDDVRRVLGEVGGIKRDVEEIKFLLQQRS